MSSSEVAIQVEQLGKCYHIYASPRDRLRQFVVPKLQRLICKPPQQYFREFWALRDVSFEVHAGETLGIIGKNGAGKSTLLQLICGTATPSVGAVSTHGRLAALLELGAGFNPDFTGRENVFASGAIYGLAQAEMAGKFSQVAAFAEIGEFIDQPVRTYSSGMYLRLAFAVQVCLDPDILIVDEALAVGDAYFVHRCFDRIRDMKSSGKTILFVSHDAGSVRALCDRAIWIDNGQIRFIGKPDDAVTRYRAHLFGIPIPQPDDTKIASYERNLPSSLYQSFGHYETQIPNIDRRIGQQQCKLIGVGIYDPTTHQPVAEHESGMPLFLRASYANVSLPAGTPLIVGFALRTRTGEEFAAINSRMVGQDIASLPPGQISSVQVKLALPMLHPGNYSFSIAIATWNGATTTIQDRIDNCIVLRVHSDLEIIGLTRFPVEFIVESGHLCDPSLSDT